MSPALGMALAAAGPEAEAALAGVTVELLEVQSGKHSVKSQGICSYSGEQVVCGHHEVAHIAERKRYYYVCET